MSRNQRCIATLMATILLALAPVVSHALETLSSAKVSPEKVSSAKVSPRIVGGSDASSAYPWMVWLEIDIDANNVTYCGGTLIDPYWVLTAAHCVEDLNEDQGNRITATIGALDRTDRSAETRGIERFIIHEDYLDTFSADNDIALLRLQSPSINTPVSLISANEMANVTAGTNTLVMGWGATSDSTPVLPRILQEVLLPLRSTSQCRERLEEVLGITLDGDIICAGYDDVQKDSCLGDSGGPLLIDVAGDLKQAGLVSFGLDTTCAVPRSYGYYTRIASYLDWIEGKLDKVFLLSSSSPDLGDVIPGRTVTGTLEFVNYTSAAVTLLPAQLSQNTGDFVITADGCEGTLAVGGTCSIAIASTPLSDGSEEVATLVIDSNEIETITTQVRVTTLTRLNSNDALYQFSLPVYSGGDKPWANSDVALDNLSLGSGAVGSNGYSILAIDVSSVDELAVRIKVSSEEDYDVLLIRRDGNPYTVRSGESDWELITVPTRGIASVEFIYQKDDNTSTGSDRAWVDSEALRPSASGGGGGGSLGIVGLTPLLLLCLRHKERLWLRRALSGK